LLATAWAVTQSVRRAVSPLESNGAPSSAASTKILLARVVHVRVGLQAFLPAGIGERRPLERREIHFALGPDDAELIALDPRVPADVHGRAQNVLVFNRSFGLVDPGEEK
jgi:hypothetical protein